ncbi:hypothetical protein STANM309S_03605 [Streptomyces tanashiensis]
MTSAPRSSRTPPPKAFATPSPSPVPSEPTVRPPSAWPTRTIHRIVKPRTTSPAKATSRRERSRTPTRVTRAAKAKGSRIEPRRSAFASVMPVNSSSTA